MIKKLLLGILIISTAYVSGINAMQLNQNKVFNNTQNQNINTNNTINKLEKSITQLNNRYINEDFINRVIDFNNQNGNSHILKIYEYLNGVESNINESKKNLNKKDHKSNLQKQDINNLKLDDLQLKIQNVKNQTNTLIKNVGQRLDSEIEKLIVQVKNNYNINKNVFAKYSIKYTELNNYLQKLQSILSDTVYKNIYFKLRVLGNLINKLTVQIDNTKSNIKNHKNEYSNENKIQYGNKVRNDLIQKNNKKYNNNILKDIVFQNFDKALTNNAHNAIQKLDSEIEKLIVQVKKDIKVLTDQTTDNYNIDKNTLDKYSTQYNELKSIVENNKDKINNDIKKKIRVLGNLITKLEVVKNTKPLTNTLFQDFDDNNNNNLLKNTLFQDFNNNNSLKNTLFQDFMNEDESQNNDTNKSIDSPVNVSDIVTESDDTIILDDNHDSLNNNHSSPNNTVVVHDISQESEKLQNDLLQDKNEMLFLTDLLGKFYNNTQYNNTNTLHKDENEFIIEHNNDNDINTNKNQLFDSIVEIKSNIHNKNTNPNVIIDNNIQQSIENNGENNISIESDLSSDNSVENGISTNEFNISNNNSLNYISTNNSSPYNKTNNNSIQNNKDKINNTNESIEMNSLLNSYVENNKYSNNNTNSEIENNKTSTSTANETNDNSNTSTFNFIKATKAAINKYVVSSN